MRKSRVSNAFVKGDLLPGDWARRRNAVLMRDRYECQSCGALGAAFEVDHIVPRADGGTHHLANLQTLCRKCHIEKTARDEGHEPVVGQADWAEFTKRSRRRAF